MDIYVLCEMNDGSNKNSSSSSSSSSYSIDITTFNRKRGMKSIKKGDYFKKKTPQMLRSWHKGKRFPSQLRQRGTSVGHDDMSPPLCSV